IIIRVELVNSRRVHIGRRGNGAHAAVAHVGEQERFAPHKHVEGASRTGGWSRTGGFSERVEKSLGVIPIARAVFHPGDRGGISLQEALDQLWSDPDDRHRWNMVDINFQTRIADALHYFAEVTVETFFADVFVIKRRKHQHASATVFYEIGRRPPRFALRTQSD